MMLIGLLLIGLVVYLLFTPKYSSVEMHRTAPFMDPLETAKIRLARGEITIEEYESIKKVIL